MSRKRIKYSKTSDKNSIVIQDKETMERFDSIFKKQLMIPEKGFNLERNEKMIMPFSIQEIVEALNCNQFFDARSLPKQELMRDYMPI